MYASIKLLGKEIDHHTKKIEEKSVQNWKLLSIPYIYYKQKPSMSLPYLIATKFPVVFVFVRIPVEILKNPFFSHIFTNESTLVSNVKSLYNYSLSEDQNGETVMNKWVSE